MNVYYSRTTVMQMLVVTILKDRLTVHVVKDIKAMALIVKVKL